MRREDLEQLPCGRGVCLERGHEVAVHDDCVELLLPEQVGDERLPLSEDLAMQVAHVEDRHLTSQAWGRNRDLAKCRTCCVAPGEDG